MVLSDHPSATITSFIWPEVNIQASDWKATATKRKKEKVDVLLEGLVTNDIMSLSLGGIIFPAISLGKNVFIVT